MATTSSSEPVAAAAALPTKSHTPLPVSSQEVQNAQEVVSEVKTNDAPSVDDYGLMLDNNGRAFKIPDFTINELRSAIPPHCFERSAVRGFMYVLRDLSCLAVTFWAFNTYNTEEYVASVNLRFVLWAIYGFVQGLFGTGVWVLAHECGHQAFSPSKTLNDTVGWVLHSALLVPYFSWKISHGKHHKATGHMERDMVFLPKTREIFSSRVKIAVKDLSHVAEDSPIHSLLYLIVRQLFGWPLYLLINATGHNFHERQPEGRGVGKKNGIGGRVNHFDTSSPLFEARDAKWILLSDVGIASMVTILVGLAKTYGWQNMLIWYFMPYLWVNHWLVAITYLQHTDPSLAHYTPKAWSYVRGAACTIDREFGFIGRQLFHGIIETHVLHHYVSTIPFYHADEATESIKVVMGEHYKSDVKNGSLGFLQSLWNNLRSCQWVEPSEGSKGPGREVLFFRNRNHIGVPPAHIQ